MSSKRRKVHINLAGPRSEVFRFFCGCAWVYDDSICSHTYRVRRGPDYRSDDLGFRFLLIPQFQLQWKN